MAGRFNVAANAIISRADGKILILKRKPNYDHDPDRWDTVSGRLKQDIENVKSELRREIREELGEEFKCQIIAPFSTYNFYRGGDKNKEIVGIDYVCLYESGSVKLSSEHTDYKWIDPKEFLEMDITDSLKRAVSIYMKSKEWYQSNADLFS